MDAHRHPRPWHAGSLFGAGPRRPLDRNGRRLWLAMVDNARRAGHLTALHLETARALLRRLSVDGQLDPAHATIARDASCSERTVRRALAVLADLGLLRWQRRLVRAGWRTEQTSNAYEILIPDRPLTAPTPRPACGGQAGRETLKADLPLADAAAVQAAKQALDRIAKERQALLMERRS